MAGNKNKPLQYLRYFIIDILVAEIAWFGIFLFRKKIIETQIWNYNFPIEYNHKFYIALLLSPVFWLFIHHLSGFYRNIYKKSFLGLIGKTFGSVMLGSVVLFFVVFLDDIVLTYSDYYKILVFYFTLHFACSLFGRSMVYAYTAGQIKKRKIWFNTIVIGSSQEADSVQKSFKNNGHQGGLKIIGYVNIEKDEKQDANSNLQCLGNIDKVISIVKLYRVEEVIFATESSEKHLLQKIITDLSARQVHIYITPTLFDVISGAVNISNLFGMPMMEVAAVKMPQWQITFKRLFDVAVSVFVLTVLLPVFLLVALAIKLDSKGSVLYSHKRIGRWGKQFRIYKFRTMVKDAEKSGPQLSSANDARITRVGKILRKIRIDEFPQFYNVLIGQMSVVGPRPEREFFVKQLLDKVPVYKLISRVKPGITSWGMVKYGYAENVDQMTNRLYYDLLYVENMSLALDFKIIGNTFLTILKAEGK